MRLPLALPVAACLLVSALVGCAAPPTYTYRPIEADDYTRHVAERRALNQANRDRLLVSSRRYHSGLLADLEAQQRAHAVAGTGYSHFSTGTYTTYPGVLYFGGTHHGGLHHGSHFGGHGFHGGFHGSGFRGSFHHSSGGFHLHGSFGGGLHCP